MYLHPGPRIYLPSLAFLIAFIFTFTATYRAQATSFALLFDSRIYDGCTESPKVFRNPMMPPLAFLKIDDDNKTIIRCGSNVAAEYETHSRDFSHTVNYKERYLTDEKITPAPGEIICGYHVTISSWHADAQWVIPTPSPNQLVLFLSAVGAGSDFDQTRSWIEGAVIWRTLRIVDQTRSFRCDQSGFSMAQGQAKNGDRHLSVSCEKGQIVYIFDRKQRIYGPC